MPLHPDAQANLAARNAAGFRPVNELSVEQARNQTVAMTALLGPGEPVAKVVDRDVPGPHGAIPVRIYTPAGAPPFPVVVYLHGGGWVLGSLESADVFCRQLTNAVPCSVVSVNYRHAPEYKFPVPADDSFAAVQWVAEQAHTFGGDANRIAIAGSSAGGNLAAAATLMCRDQGGPKLAGQILIVPVTDYTLDTKSYIENEEGYALTRESMAWFWRHYLKEGADGANPLASPLRAASHSGLPPAFVATAEYDPLRDEGEAYARRLQSSGVPVTHRRYDGMIHGFQGPALMQDIAMHLGSIFQKKTTAGVELTVGQSEETQ